MVRHSMWAAALSLFVLMPPERFTHYDKPVNEIVLTQAAAINLCLKMIGTPAFACQWFEKKTGECVIVIPFNGIGSLADYRTHERAHCAGWTNAHEGAHF